MIGALALWAWTAVTSRPEEPAVLQQFELALPSESHSISRSSLALSPDGRYIAYFSGQANIDRQLYLHRLDQIEGVPVAGTEGGSNPFFSADSQAVGFVSLFTRSISTVQVAGGEVFGVARASNRSFASWGADGVIVYSQDDNGPFRIPGSGAGAPELLVAPDREAGQQRFRRPFVLPGGSAVLFEIAQVGGPTIAVLSLGTGVVTPLVGGRDPSYVPTGHLVFARGSTLYAAPLDTDRLLLTGREAPILQGVRSDVGDFSPDGRFLTYHSDKTREWHVYVQEFATGRRWLFDATSDGRFLLVTRGALAELEEGFANPRIRVSVNYFDHLRELVPVAR